jgi:hypothetical protein
MTLCAGGVDGELETADLIGVYRPKHDEEQLADLGLEVVRQPTVDGLTHNALVQDSYRHAHVKLAVALRVDDCKFGQFAKVREQLYKTNGQPRSYVGCKVPTGGIVGAKWGDALTPDTQAHLH